MARVAIIGAGFAGHTAALYLGDKLPRLARPDLRGRPPRFAPVGQDVPSAWTSPRTTDRHPMTAPDEGLASLRTTSDEHHARLLPHVDRLLSLAEMVGHVECTSLHALFEDEYRFIVGQLVPHMETIERTLYDRIEAELSGHHSLAPMREEHRTIARLVAELGRYKVHAEECNWSAMEGMALRRALYRLHALLKVHLAEEELYLNVLERNLDDAEKDLLARSLGHAMAEGL